MSAAGRPLVVLVGPTAVGKSAVAEAIAKRTGAAVLSADSMQIYRGMDIGTAKPDRQTRERVDYLGVDLVDPCESFSVWAYREAVAAQLALMPADREVIVAGGSGLYVKALTMGLGAAGAGAATRVRWESLFAEQGVAGLQQALRQRDTAVFDALSDPRNPRRLIRALERLDAGDDAPETGCAWRESAAQPVLAGLWMESVLLNKRIEQRVEAMYDAGLLEEVSTLLADPRGLSPTARQAIGYAEAIDVLEGRCSRVEAVARTSARTRRLAKRQRTWFRHQARVEWVHRTMEDTVESLADRVQGIWRMHGNARMA